MTDGDASDIPEAIYLEAGRWLNRLEAGEPGVQAKIDVWLAAAADHRRAYAFTRDFLRESAGLRQTAVGAGGKLPLAPFYLRQRVQVAFATLAAVALAGGTTFLLVGRDALPSFATRAQAATYQTRVGEVRSFGLPDGTRITLDTDTRLSLRSDGASTRFDLAHGRFRVVTSTGALTFLAADRASEIRIEGSSFDAARSGDALRIVAVDAPVHLAGASDSGAGPRRLLPGMASPHGPGDPSLPHIASDRDWVSGMLTLDATPLDEAITAINRYNTVKIRLGRTDLADHRISGAYRVNDPQAFAEAVAGLFAIGVARSPGELVLGDPRTGKF